MGEQWYNNKIQKTKEKKPRLEQIFCLIRNDEKYLNEWKKGRIEIHFSGESVTMSITKF